MSTTIIINGAVHRVFYNTITELKAAIKALFAEE
jgi:hypothetical protein